MPKTNPDFVPTYRKHKSTGQAVVTLGGKDHYLGRYGTKDSKAEYDRLIAEWLAGGRRLHHVNVGLSVAEVDAGVLGPRALGSITAGRTARLRTN